MMWSRCQTPSANITTEIIATTATRVMFLPRPAPKQLVRTIVGRRPTIKRKTNRRIGNLVRPAIQQTTSSGKPGSRKIANRMKEALLALIMKSNLSITDFLKIFSRIGRPKEDDIKDVVNYEYGENNSGDDNFNLSAARKAFPDQRFTGIKTTWHILRREFPESH